MASVSRMFARNLFVAEAFAFARAGHEARDIDEFNNGRHHALGIDDSRERRQPRVRHFDHADIRLDRAERIVFGGDADLGQCIEQCGLADVRQADDAALEAHGILRTGETACAAWVNAGCACRGFQPPGTHAHSGRPRRAGRKIRYCSATGGSAGRPGTAATGRRTR